VVIEPEFAPGNVFRSGLVVFHSPNKEEANRITHEIQLQHPSVMCTNTTPIIINRLLFGWGWDVIRNESDADSANSLSTD
jgi:hypothetical protein